MQNIYYIIIAVVMGAIVAIYLPMNSSIARHLGSGFLANAIFFGVAFVTATLMYILLDPGGVIANVGKVPPYMYTTGFISAFFILGTIFLVPHLGARQMFVLIVTGQIIMSIVVSHFGILESPKDPVTAKKLIGSFVVIFGAYISTS